MVRKVIPGERKCVWKVLVDFLRRNRATSLKSVRGMLLTSLFPPQDSIETTFHKWPKKRDRSINWIFSPVFAASQQKICC